MLVLLAAVLVIPPGLDLYMPVPEGNPITAEKIELGRRLFHDRRLAVLLHRNNTIPALSRHTAGVDWASEGVCFPVAGCARRAVS
jgi:hypothetical protein